MSRYHSNFKALRVEKRMPDPTLPRYGTDLHATAERRFPHGLIRVRLQRCQPVELKVMTARHIDGKRQRPFLRL